MFVDIDITDDYIVYCRYTNSKEKCVQMAT